MGKDKVPQALQTRKVDKIKLNKEQKIRVAQMIRLENRIGVCREYIAYWSQFFHFFADDIQKRTITEPEEKAFFQTLTLLARKHFLFCELMGDAFDSRERIMDVLTSSVALSNIKAMNEAALSKLELDWHTTLLEMYVALGRLLRQLPAGMKIDDALAQADALAKPMEGTLLESHPPGALKVPPKKGGWFGRAKKA